MSEIDTFCGAMSFPIPFKALSHSGDGCIKLELASSGIGSSNIVSVIIKKLVLATAGFVNASQKIVGKIV